MGIRSDLDAAKKALADAAMKIDVAVKSYEEKKKKLEDGLGKAEQAVVAVEKMAASGPGAAVPGLQAGAKTAAAAVAAARSTAR